ncbi:MAG: hypothetical protein KatS3mg076_0068 [Candidatus Binatia bacterium]|nr:MAG: hypothetical protein KatS3mg076_0068 [Candidatus Binatia bacterium]
MVQFPWRQASAVGAYLLLAPARSLRRSLSYPDTLFVPATLPHHPLLGAGR